MFHVIHVLVVLLFTLNTSNADETIAPPDNDCFKHPPGKLFRPEACVICMCDKNKMKTCKPIECKPLGKCRKSEVPEGKCCPVCLECFFNRNVLQDGDAVQLGPCLTCRCSSGGMHCTPTQCRTDASIQPPFEGLKPCKHATFCKGQCCPRCQHGPDETCHEQEGVCVEPHKIFFYTNPIDKCTDGQTCVPLPELHSSGGVFIAT